MSFARKLLRPHICKRIFFERLTEPLHLNLLSLVVGTFGSFRQKVAFDLVIRAHNAYGLLKAADLARSHGINEISALEFGVGSGPGLMNMEKIAGKVEAETGVKIHLSGFDTGKGMPAAVDYRDHPEIYEKGDYPMNFDKLRAALPKHVELVLGELKETLPVWMERNLEGRPIGYVVVDVDYYTSTVDALNILKGSPAHYLPFVVVYMDDIVMEMHNSWCGELLAMREFNDSNKYRKIVHPAFIARDRVFKHAPWLQQMFFCHVLDHATRQPGRPNRNVISLQNPYL
jgi:hypothetical protein